VPAGRFAGCESFRIARNLTFFRQTALLLPSAFLLGVLLFLLTHGRHDPGFGVYPFFEEWAGSSWIASTPEGRFVEQAALFFVPLYLVTLLFLLCVSVAEMALFGPRKSVRETPYRAAFARAFALLYLIASALLVFFGDRWVALSAPGALVGPVLVAFVPFLAPALALLPAALVAAPIAAIRKEGLA